MDQTLQGPAGAAPPDWRGLCWALDSLLDGVKQHDLPGMLGLGEEECDRIWCIYQSARAALAQPEPEVAGPSDDELWDIGERHLWTGTDDSSAAYYRTLTSFIQAARAVLSRWGRLAPAPVSDDDLDLLVIAIQALRPEASPNSHDLAAVDRGSEILRQWLTARGMA